MWPCYGVHISLAWCAWHFLFVHVTLSASALMDWAIPTSTIFLFRSLFRKTCFCSFLINFFQFVLRVDASSSHMCTDEWHPTASTLYPLSLPHKKSAGGKSQLHSKQSSNGPSPENFLTIGGCFECYTYRVMTQGWLRKEERKKMNNSAWLSNVSGLPL